MSPEWVQDVDAVEACLKDIELQMKDLEALHASRVGSVFGKDLQGMEERIERMTREITDQFRHAERLLQKVGTATRRAGGEEATVGANVQRRYVLGDRHTRMYTALSLAHFHQLSTSHPSPLFANNFAHYQSRQAITRALRQISTISKEIPGRSTSTKEWRSRSRFEVWHRLGRHHWQ